MVTAGPSLPEAGVEPSLPEEVGPALEAAEPGPAPEGASYPAPEGAPCPGLEAQMPRGEVEELHRLAGVEPCPREDVEQPSHPMVVAAPTPEAAEPHPVAKPLLR